MARPSSITAAQIQAVNRAAILEWLRRSGPASRAAIAKDLGLSRTTVGHGLDGLSAAKLVRVIDNGSGRALIGFNGDQLLCLSLDLGGTKFYGAVTSLAGEILFEHTLSRHGSQGEQSYRLVVEMLTEMLAQAQATGLHVMGIGVGAPGVMRHEEGLVVGAAALEWNNFPLKPRLQEHFHLPVAVDNDVNLAALGETWFGAGVDRGSLVWINIGTGIGAGLMVDGMLYRGAREMAGEIGYLIPGREFLRADYPGFGALELQAGGIGIAQRATQALKNSRTDGAVAKAEATATAKTLAEAYHNGEPWAIDLMGETLDYLAIALGAVIACLDPELIVLGGGVMRSLDEFVEELAHRLKGKVPSVPPIVVSALGQRAAVLGAMINLLHTISDFYVVRKLS